MSIDMWRKHQVIQDRHLQFMEQHVCCFHICAISRTNGCIHSLTQFHLTQSADPSLGHVIQHMTWSPTSFPWCSCYDFFELKTACTSRTCIWCIDKGDESPKKAVPKSPAAAGSSKKESIEFDPTDLSNIFVDVQGNKLNSLKQMVP